MSDTIYLDNAATSYPKPGSVIDAVNEAMLNAGNPGRSGHALSLWSGRAIESARINVAAIFGEQNASRIVFALNTTDALNTAIHGILNAAGTDNLDPATGKEHSNPAAGKDSPHPASAALPHVVTTSMEHNSVIRPLEALTEAGTLGSYTAVKTDQKNGTDPALIKAAIRPDTRLVVCTHVSNVTGTVNPVSEIGLVCKEAGIPFLVDAAQSAGYIPFTAKELNADMIAFPGHKGLLGPQGTGGLWIREGFELKESRQGGTGSKSEERSQPKDMPDRFESGTQNTIGLAGLSAGAGYVLDRGIAAIAAHEAAMSNKMLDGLSRIKGIEIFGPPQGRGRSGVISFRINGTSPQETSSILDNAFNIAVRSGLHCAPIAHETIGTLNTGGTVRVSAGIFTTEGETDAFLEAVAEIANG
ncbi:MAG: aminotransferase class V-fold PLP-dependent enzyme [Clostridiales Family XIII bacterium]|jgi:cysteine desulfurase family protein|nr:aminotransferase class V-fold PLP-dependent enzyme [Clostridiales Family XIII bacterium]